MNLWEVYQNSFNALFESFFEMFPHNELRKDFENYLDNINKLTKYMLFDKSLPSKKKALSREEKRNKEKLYENSTDLLLYFGVISESALKKDRKKAFRAIKHNDFIKFYKALEQFILKGKYNLDLNELSLGIFSADSKYIYDSLPKLLVSIKQVIDEEERKALLILLFSSVTIYRQFKTKAEASPLTIINPYNGKSLRSIIAEDFSNQKIQQWLSSFSHFNIFDKDRVNILFYSGNASSPNSSASVGRLMDDYIAVSQDPPLFSAIKELGRHFNNAHEFLTLLDHLACNIESIGESVKERIHSRLFTFTAPGGKARIIANVDWVTQTALSGIHFYLFEFLSIIKSDCTFDHKGGLEKIWKKGSKDHYYSIDLSAATDRMPRALQQVMIKSLFLKLKMDGESISNAWATIVDREYSTVGTKLMADIPLRYEVGQGMGLFTSWPIMALMHHFIVNKICNIPLDDYILVGDDLTIRNNKEGYLKYVDFMSSIGVEVNLNKTLVSETEEDVNIEFARNFVIAGVRVDPINFGALIAYTDGKTSFDSFLYLHKHNLSSNFVLKLIKNFRAGLRTVDIVQIAYFLFKSNQLNSNTQSLFFKELGLPDWFLTIDFKRITKFIAQKVSKYTKLTKYIPARDEGYFMSASASSAVVRLPIDISRARDVADYMDELNDLLLSQSRYAYKDTIDIINAIYNRSTNVSLIQYDIDGYGNPLINKRERKFLCGLTNVFEEKNKSNAVLLAFANIKPSLIE